MKKLLRSSKGSNFLLIFNFKMKLTTLLIIASLFSMQAKNSYGQIGKITLHLKNTSLKEFIDEIEYNTDYRFVFKVKDVDLSRAFSISVKDTPLDDVLTQVFSGTQTKYTIVRQRVYLTKGIFETQDSDLKIKPEQLQLRQQKLLLTGIVKDENSQPLLGVTIMEKGTNNGTTTNFDGEFSISVKTGSTLQFSYLGYLTKEVMVADQNSIHLQLVPDTQELNEVVIVGYGVQKKANLTGAISTVKSEDLEDISNTSTAAALQGRLSGVSITRSNGKPGATSEIRIRGLGTFGDNNPLIVIDGIIVENGIDSMDPSDIESVNVLKDAASSAIYGSRAANGVILISTKKGKLGKGEINLNLYTGVQSILNKPELSNAAQFVELQNEARFNANRWLGTNYDMFFDQTPSSYGKGTDWLDQMYRVAQLQSLNVSASGGNEKSKFYTSGSYLKQDGIRVNSGYERANFRVNFNSDFTDHLSVGANLNLSYRTTFGSPAQGDDVIYVPPTIPLSEPDGGPGYGKHAGENAMSPIFYANLDTPTEDDYRSLANAFFNYRINDIFSFRFQGGVDFNYRENRAFSHTYNVADIWTNSRSNYYEQRSKGLTWLTDYLLNFKKTFNQEHDIDGVVGFSMQQITNDGIFGRAYDYISEVDLMHVLNAGTNPNDSRTGGGKSQLSLMSYFGRVNYSIKDKYLFSANFRADGSSRFIGENTWGFFPSISGAWRIDKEDFFNVAAVSNLKLRLNWGQLGNQSVGSRYPSIETLNSTYAILGPGGDNHVIVPGYYQSQLVNKNLKWETTTITNLGIDLGMFQGRLNTTVEYFEKVTDDILRTQVLPATVGMGAPVVNYASVKNSGVELDINWSDTVGELKYSIGFNMATLNNKVLKLSDGNDREIINGPHRDVYINQVGKPMMSFWGWKQEGIYSSQEDIDNSPTYSSAVIGSLKFKDINGDGKIDANDRTIIGDAIPNVTGGITLKVQYKGFDFMIFGQGDLGKEQFNPYPKWINDGWRNYPKFYYENRWTGQGEPGMFPAVVWGAASSMNQMNDFLLSNVSYFRIKNASLGYTLQLKKLGEARFYISGENLLTIASKDYFGFDPENAGTSQYFYWGDSYPSAKTFMVGLHLKM